MTEAANDGASREPAPPDRAAEGHAYAEVTGAEREQILKALIDSMDADARLRAALLINVYNAGEANHATNLVLGDALTRDDKPCEFAAEIRKVFTHVLKDDEGICWLVKKRKKGFDVLGDWMQNVRYREEFAYRLLRHTSNQAEIRRITEEDLKRSPGLGAIADNLEACYLSRLVMDGNLDADSLPHKNEPQAASAIFVANVLIRKYDPHLFNLAYSHGVPVSVDNDMAFGFDRNLKHPESLRFPIFEFYFLRHAVYILFRVVLGESQAPEGSPNQELHRVITKMDFDEIHHRPQNVVSEFISARQRFGFGDAVMAAFALDENHLRESIREHKKIEAVRETAVEAGYAGEELDEVVALIEGNRQTLGRDVEQILRAITGRDYGFDTIDAGFPGPGRD